VAVGVDHDLAATEGPEATDEHGGTKVRRTRGADTGRDRRRGAVARRSVTASVRAPFFRVSAFVCDLRMLRDLY
jgi:hypothetical protein